MPGFFSSSKPGKGAELAVQAADVEAALVHVRKYISATPLSHSPRISDRAGHEVFVKWENKNITGSFKERGAINALSNLEAKRRQIGVCAASLGNHALALSEYASRLRIPCTIVMPVTSPLVKIQNTKNCGADVVLHGQTLSESSDLARELADTKGMYFVSAYDDKDVISGQGTVAIEILEQCPDLDSIIIPIGGGGLVSGIATLLKAKRPDVFILGVQSDWVTKSTQSGPNSPQSLLPSVSIADGIAVKRPGKLTAPIIAARVDKLHSVSESDVAGAIIGFLELERSVVEGAGAVGLAALTSGALPEHCKKTVILVSGSNIDMNLLARLMERDMGEKGRLLRLVVSVPDRPGSLHAVTGILARSGANVMHVLHDRSFSHEPGNVEITFQVEVKDQAHRGIVLRTLRDLNIQVREI